MPPHGRLVIKTQPSLRQLLPGHRFWRIPFLGQATMQKYAQLIDQKVICFFLFSISMKREA